MVSAPLLGLVVFIMTGCCCSTDLLGVPDLLDVPDKFTLLKLWLTWSMLAGVYLVAGLLDLAEAFFIVVSDSSKVVIV